MLNELSETPRASQRPVSSFPSTVTSLACTSAVSTGTTPSSLSRAVTACIAEPSASVRRTPVSLSVARTSTRFAVGPLAPLPPSATATPHR